MNQNQLSPQQQNFLARQNLLQTGIPMIKRLAPVSAAMGSTMKIPLLRMGIMTGVLLQFTVPVTITVTDSEFAVPSLVGPWNIAQVVSYNDFAGVQRTRTNGYQLWAAQSMKQGDALSLIPQMTNLDDLDTSYPANFDSDIFYRPIAPGEGEIKFSLWVPMAYDPNSDLTGAVLTQTNVGEHYINVQLANAIQSADAWTSAYLTAAGNDAVVTAGAVTVETFQHYIQPQNMSAESLPLLDLSTVYGFEGGFQLSGNIAQGQATYINYPNNRSILSALIDFMNGGDFSTPSGPGLSGITLVANSNTNFREMTPRSLRESMRNIANCDLAPSSYYIASRRQPILTQLYANVQAKFDVSLLNAGSGTQFVSQFEVQYPSGAPLPGITVAA